MSKFDILNEKLISSINLNSPIGLANGKMGLCIYFYYLSRLDKKPEFEFFSDNLLNEIMNDLFESMNISIGYGLTGIAIGIDHLIKEKFIKGNTNEVLKHVDDYIFYKLAFLDINKKENEISKSLILELLYYLYLRYLKQPPEMKYIFKELITKTIELFHNNLRPEFFNEKPSFSLNNFQLPIALYVIGKILSLNIYNDRIIKLIDDIIIPKSSYIPILQANRLYLLWGLMNIKESLICHDNTISKHIELLNKAIDINYIINTEMKNKDIYLIDGLSFIYILIRQIKKNKMNIKIECDYHNILKRLSNSEAWNDLINKDDYMFKHIGLINGFPGVNLVLKHINKQYL